MNEKINTQNDLMSEKEKRHSAIYKLFPNEGKNYEENGEKVYWNLINEGEEQEIKKNLMIDNGQKCLEIKHFKHPEYGEVVGAKWKEKEIDGSKIQKIKGKGDEEMKKSNEEADQLIK